MSKIKAFFKRTFKRGKQAKRHFLIHAYLYRKGILYDDVVLTTSVEVYPNKATITTNIAKKYEEFNIDRVKVDIPIEVSESQMMEWATIPDWYEKAAIEANRQQQEQQKTRQQRRRRNTGRRTTKKTVQ